MLPISWWSLYCIAFVELDWFISWRWSTIWSYTNWRCHLIIFSPVFIISSSYQANTCSCQDTWSQPNASFWTATHVVSQGSVTYRRSTCVFPHTRAHRLPQCHCDWQRSEYTITWPIVLPWLTATDGCCIVRIRTHDLLMVGWNFSVAPLRSTISLLK